jgi:hypothetical protein
MDNFSLNLSVESSKFYTVLGFKNVSPKSNNEGLKDMVIYLLGYQEMYAQDR